MKSLSGLLWAVVCIGSLGCGTDNSEVVEETVITVEAPEEVISNCDTLIHAWCDHQIACGNVADNVTECMELMSWKYCPADGSVEGERYSATCYHDLSTSECDSWEMSWPGSCYEALGIEEGC